MKSTAAVTLFFYLFLVMFIPVAGASPVTSENNFDDAKALGSSSIAAIGSVIGRADKALLQSSLAPNQLRGAFGESAMNVMMRSQGYSSLSPRLGPQGIDGLYLRFDSRGNPSSLIVAESKYGNSRLSMTSDGWQLSDKWTNKRLYALSKRYNEVSNIRSVTSSKLPTRGEMPRHVIEVDLGNGQKTYFWRNDANDSWKYDGPENTLEQAKKKAKSIGNYLEGASSGKVNYRKRLFQFKLEGDNLKISVGDGSKVNANGKISVTDTFEIKISALKKPEYAQEIEKEIIRQIRNKYPHITEAEAASSAKEMVKEAKDLQEIVEQARLNLFKTLAVSTALAGIIGGVFVGGIEALSELINEGHVNLSRVSKSFLMGSASAASGVLSGQGAVIWLTKTQLGYRISESLSSLLHTPSTALSANMLGALVGGSVASIVLALGGVMLGLYDEGAACRIAAVGLVGTAAGSLAGTATIGIATAIGTASTGTPIATLSGAVATKSALAWLGGGAVSAGGWGVAGGTLVLTGAGIFVFIAANTGMAYGFHVFDNYQEEKRISLMMDSLIYEKQFLLESARNSFNY